MIELATFCKFFLYVFLACQVALIWWLRSKKGP
jgi:hypothetical protein